MKTTSTQIAALALPRRGLYRIGSTRLRAKLQLQLRQTADEVLICQSPTGAHGHRPFGVLLQPSQLPRQPKRGVAQEPASQWLQAHMSCGRDYSCI